MKTTEKGARSYRRHMASQLLVELLLLVKQAEVSLQQVVEGPVGTAGWEVVFTHG